MFIPLHDANPLKIIPFQRVTVGLMGLNLLVFILQLSAGEAGFSAAVYQWGAVPVSLWPDGVADGGPSALVTVVTHLFMHASWMHLLSNMLCLWVFGDNIEDAMGHTRFLLFYLLCGLGATFLEVALYPLSAMPIIGASGAIAGVMGAYLMLHPRVRVWCLVFGRIPLRLPALIPLGLWFLLQWLSLGSPGVAWWAHIGGFITGAVLVIGMRRPSIPLWDRGVEH